MLRRLVLWVKHLWLHIVPILRIIERLVWKVIYWTPALYKRPFLVKSSRSSYVKFQLNIFVLPQLNRIIVAIASLDLAVLILTVTVDDVSYNEYTPYTPAMFVALHGVFLTVKYCSPKLFRRIHLPISLLSAISVGKISNLVNICSISSSLEVASLGFYMLIVTIYFQYSTFLTIAMNSLAFLFNIYNHLMGETVREVS